MTKLLSNLRNRSGSRKGKEQHPIWNYEIIDVRKSKIGVVDVRMSSEADEEEDN